MSNVGSLKISEYLYNILNDVSLTSVITGGIYKEAYDLNSQKEDIVIISNSLQHKKFHGTQTGIANINIIVPANANGTPKISRINKIADIVRNLLTNNNHPENAYYFDVMSETLFNEMSQEKTYYYNFKINNQKN